MKFRNGYWLLRPGVGELAAAEVYDYAFRDGLLTLSRGMTDGIVHPEFVGLAGGRFRDFGKEPFFLGRLGHQSQLWNFTR